MLFKYLSAQSSGQNMYYISSFLPKPIQVYLVTVNKREDWGKTGWYTFHSPFRSHIFMTLSLSNGLYKRYTWLLWPLILKNFWFQCMPLSVTSCQYLVKKYVQMICRLLTCDLWTYKIGGIIKPLTIEIIYERTWTSETVQWNQWPSLKDTLF